MQLAITAKNNTDSVRANLTYINTLITNAANNGLFNIVVDGVFMDDSMANNLHFNYGYRVDKQYFDMGTYPRYVIDFTEEQPTYFTQNLVLYYQGSTTDLSIANNNGSYHGGYTTSTNNCGIVTLDGSSGYISTTNLYNNPQVYSIEAWISTTTTGSGKIVGFEDHQTGTGSTNYDRQIYVNTSGQVVFGIYNDATTTESLITSTSPINDGNWHHVVATYDKNTGIGVLYVDNVSQGTFNSSQSQNFNGYWRIGSYSLNSWAGGSNGYYSGSLGIVRIYVGTALNASQVSMNFNNASSCYLDPYIPTPTPTSSLTPTPTPTPSNTPPAASPTPTPTPSAGSGHVAGADFTIEWYMKVTNWTSPTYHPRPYSLGSFPAKNAVSIENTGSHIYWWSNGTFYVDMGSLNISTNTWHHFAVARNNGVLSLFFDGIRLATGTNNSAIPSSGSPLFIGAEPNGSGGAMSNVNGKMTNFRWNKSVIYDGPTYMPPTSPSTADSNTKLLLLATNSGGLTTDSSGLGKTITNVGATWDSDSPFAGGVGGSINFAGTGYFTIPADTDWDL